MARASSSFPEPLGPSMRTVLSLTAMSGSSEKIFWKASLLPMMSSKVYWLWISLRSCSRVERSRNVSTAPRSVPFSALRTALLALMGRDRACWVRIRAGRSMTSLPVSNVSRMGQAPSHRLE